LRADARHANADGPAFDAAVDAAVVGLGVLGAFALRALAARGLRVVGFDRFHPPHALGSSHGRSRIFREACFEHPLYVPLARASRNGWRSLEKERGVRLLRRTGLLMLGPPDGIAIAGCLRSAREHGVEHDVLEGAMLAQWFPGMEAPGHVEVGVHEPGAGVLQAEGAVEAALASARALGAEVVFDSPVEDLERPGGLDVRSVVVATGSWLPALIGARIPLSVERQVTYWFGLRGPGWTKGRSSTRIPAAGLQEFAPGRYLYWIVENDEEGGGDGVIKAALHHGGAMVEHPDRMDRSPGPDDETPIRGTLERLFPGQIGETQRAVVCPYTNTPDGHFLVGPHPSHPRRILLGGGSGHAFKFAPALGERVADWVTGLREAGPDDPFLPARFGPA
jgi:sarcosine oxidase